MIVAMNVPCFMDLRGASMGWPAQQKTLFFLIYTLVIHSFKHERIGRVTPQ